MKKRISMILLMGLMIFAVSKVNLHAEENITKISTPQQLNNVRNNLNGNYELTNDIDMSQIEDYEPIGNEVDGAFKGTFDGKGYTIKNVQMDDNSHKYAGLFGYLDGKVQNVKLQNAVIKASRYAGGIAGYLDENGSVRGCVVSGDIGLSKDNYGFTRYVGGIIGYVNGKILECENRVNLGDRGDYRGGIAGYSNNDIKKCENYGNLIKGAGIAEYVNGNIEDCMNYGNINGDNVTYGIGSANKIIHCGNNGDVTGSRYGYNYGIGKASKIENCINTGMGSYYPYHTQCQVSNSMNLGYSESGYGIVSLQGSNGSYLNSGAYFDISIAGGSKTFYRCLPKKRLSECLDQDYKKKLDDQLNDDLWETDPEWNSGLPMLKNIPKHLELSELAVTLFQGESIQLKGRVGKKEITDLTWESSSSSALKVTKSGIVTSLIDTNWITWVKATTSDGLTMRCIVLLCSKKPTSVDISGEKIQKDQADLKVGETQQLKATFNHSRAESNLTWSSSNPEVASIDQNGLVVAKKIGVTTIKVITDNGCQDSVTINVKYANKLTLDKTNIRVGVNKYFDLIPKLEPQDALDTFQMTMRRNDIGSSWNYNSSGYKDGAFKNCYITQPGNYTATVTTTGGESAECNILVSDFNLPSQKTVNIKNKISLNPTFKPIGIDQTLTWSSINESVATVDQNGIVTGLKPGEAQIKAVSDTGVEHICKVIVTGYPEAVKPDRTSIDLKVGDTDKITMTFTPEGTKDQVSYQSSNTAVVSVDENGKLTANSKGTATITITTSNGLKAYCNINVTEAEIPVTTVTLNKTELTLYPTQKESLTCKILPENATNKKLTWKSSNEKVATVNNAGMVTAIQPGTADITAELENGIKRTCTVTVKKKLTAAIALKEVKATPGEEIEVPVVLSDNPGISAMKVSIDYDSNILTPLIVEKTSILDAATIKGEKQEEGIYNVLWYSTKDINENGTILKIRFKVNETASVNTETKLKLTSVDGDICDAQHNDVHLNDADGAIEIKETLYGDVYEDEVLNSHDVLLLQQYLTELAQFTNRQLLLADITNDNKVNMQDLVALANKVTINPSIAKTVRMAKASVQSTEKQQMEINIGQQKIDKDGYVDIPVNFTNCTGISAFRFKLDYDRSIMQLLSIAGEAEEVKDHLMVNLNDTTDGKSLVTWFSDKNVIFDGNILTLRFKVDKDKLGSGADITLSWDKDDLCDEDLNTVEATINYGKVLPEDKKPADSSTDITIPTTLEKPSPQEPSETESKPQTTDKQTKVDKISIAAISNKIAVSKKVKLTANISNNATNKSVSWVSSNTKIATVDQNGVVRFNKKAAGKTVMITAIANDGSGKMATFKLTAMKGIVKKITISGKKSVKAGKTLKLKAKVKATKGANKKLLWNSNNTKYATVSTSGKVKVMKAGKGKKVKITAMATDGSGKKKTVTIKIK